MAEKPIVLSPGKGRSYACGPMTAVFKADGRETRDPYSVSEWAVSAAQPGVWAHAHESNEELFLVTQGVMSIRVGDEWI